MKNWKVNSWRQYPVKHVPKYDDDRELNNVLNKLKTLLKHFQVAYEKLEKK